jgi:hypothetical protein
MRYDLNWTIRQAALEVARVAHEGLGSTQFERLRATFSRKVEQESDDEEVRLRAVTRLLIEKTRKGSNKDVADIQTAGLCLMWLADTRVSEWTLLQLYSWGASLV